MGHLASSYAYPHCLLQQIDFSILAKQKVINKHAERMGLCGLSGQVNDSVSQRKLYTLKRRSHASRTRFATNQLTKL